MKKKIALLQGGFNGEVMKYAIRGIRKRIQEEGADLYIFSCYGGEKEDLLYNQGEYQIFSLLDCNEYDGFLMASNNITSGEEREKLRKKRLEMMWICIRSLRPQLDSPERIWKIC